MVIIGIDPGKSGGIAVLRQFNNPKTSIHEMPLLPDNSIDCKNLHTLFVNILFQNEDTICFIEKSQPMPKQGVKGVFSYGVSYGLIKGALICAIIPYQEIPPQRWKKFFGLDSDKKKAVSFAIKLFPEFKDEFYTPRGRLLDGKAEALLIAEYGRRNLNND
jgi:crossover junction endodeoxyribonuclease RuvC